ncbi:MAG: hypothetical protein E7435_05655 [Ruminococcaceae bacterium]|nr:hypothetical protein [Oscillospiraceae bacterium]
MKNIVFKKKADARWKGNGFGEYRCSQCWTIVSGNHHLICPGCKAQMHKPGDLIYDEATGEAEIVKLREEIIK